MSTLKRILFLVTFIVLVTQTFRHFYYRWLDPSSSALAKYDSQLTREIEKAGSLDVLVARYELVRTQIDSLESTASFKSLERVERLSHPLYAAEQQLNNAIARWETQSREIFKLRIYFAFGLILVFGGVLYYRNWNPWFGLGLIVAGFAELIYWSSPSLFGGETLEYMRLLVNKFYLSLTALVVLLIAGALTNTVLLEGQQSHDRKPA